MSLKKQWEDTGKNLGSAFTGLGKTVLKTVRTGIDKVDDKVDGKETPAEEQNVFNDGSWRETGDQLGGAFKKLGKTIVETAKGGLDRDGEKEE